MSQLLCHSYVTSMSHTSLLCHTRHFYVTHVTCYVTLLFQCREILLLYVLIECFCFKEKPEGSEAPGEEEEGVPGPAGESDSETKAKETEEFKESESAEKKVEEPQEGAEKTESDSKEESSEKTEDAAKEKDEKPKSDKVCSLSYV